MSKTCDPPILTGFLHSHTLDQADWWRAERRMKFSCSTLSLLLGREGCWSSSPLGTRFAVKESRNQQHADPVWYGLLFQDHLMVDERAATVVMSKLLFTEEMTLSSFLCESATRLYLLDPPRARPTFHRRECLRSIRFGAFEHSVEVSSSVEVEVFRIHTVRSPVQST